MDPIDKKTVAPFDDGRIPAFFLDNAWQNDSDALPAIQTTVPLLDENGSYIGRVYDSHYPRMGNPDPDGDLALSLGARYYEEGMEHRSADERETRIECFQAAEILYLHAAAKGNATAYANLGYVYSYDRCEGRYLGNRHDAKENDGSPYPREKRAFECFSYAAERNDVEACYKLGDMLKRGIGCEADPFEAFAWYRRAYELGENNEQSHILGSIALRLGDACEHGIGCEADLDKALWWYERAKVALSIGVNSGAHYYAGTLEGAKGSIARVRHALDETR